MLLNEKSWRTFLGLGKGLMQRPLSNHAPPKNSRCGSENFEVYILWGSTAQSDGVYSYPKYCALAADCPLSRLREADHKEVGFSQARRLIIAASGQERKEF